MESSTLQISRVEDGLPMGFDALRETAEAEGIRNVAAVPGDWAGDAFAEPGSLFAAWVDGTLVGLGGVTPQPGLSEPAMRVRRLYVLPSARRSGVGRALASAMIQQGFEAANLLTCNARASAAAPPFWESLGFTVAPAGYNFTHWLRRT